MMSEAESRDSCQQSETKNKGTTVVGALLGVVATAPT